MSTTSRVPPCNPPQSLSLPNAVWEPILSWLSAVPAHSQGSRARLSAPTQIQALTDQAGHSGRTGSPLRFTMPKDSWPKLAAQLDLWADNPHLIPAAHPPAPLTAMGALADLIHTHLHPPPALT